MGRGAADGINRVHRPGLQGHDARARQHRGARSHGKKGAIRSPGGHLGWATFFMKGEVRMMHGDRLYSRVCTFFALLCTFLLPSPAVAAPPPNPATITALAADAYVWGLGPETVYRLAKYN